MVWHRRPQFSHSWRGDNYSRWGAPEGPCDQHTHGLWFCTNCDVGPESAAPVPTEVTATTAPSSPPPQVLLGTWALTLAQTPPRTSQQEHVDPHMTRATSCTASHTLRKIHRFTLLQSTFCLGKLSCLFVFKYSGSGKSHCFVFFPAYAI